MVADDQRRRGAWRPQRSVMVSASVINVCGDLKLVSPSAQAGSQAPSSTSVPEAAKIVWYVVEPELPGRSKALTEI